MIQIGDIFLHPKYGNKTTIESFDGNELRIIWYDESYGFRRETILMNPDIGIGEYRKNKRRELVIAIIKEGNV